MDRQTQLLNVKDNRPFDVVVIGGGVSGAPLYNALCREGYRVLLVDKGDFASGTSQASGMMVWGGLLYLKQMDVLTVKKLCNARDELIRSLPGAVASRQFRFLPAQAGGQSPWFVMLGLYLYWLLGDSRRGLPSRWDEFTERTLVNDGQIKTSLMFEEAFLKHSDSRYVLDWIRQHNTEDTVPLNYCAVAGGAFDSAQRNWRLDLRNVLNGDEFQVTTSAVINCCGVWTDSVNQLLGVTSKFRHVMSKGVYINLPRPQQHQAPLVFEMEDLDDVITYVPWGPVSMWGPTETTVTDIGHAQKPNVDDIRFLLNRANKNLKRTIGPDAIVSMRCGIRPLAVDKDYDKDEYPLELSRKYAINHDSHRQAISIYGGKLTTSSSLATQVVRLLDSLKPSGKPSTHVNAPPEGLTTILGISNQVSPDHARDHEFCCTLEDYLRRRTNVSQWICRRGLGKEDEHSGELKAIAETFVATSGMSASTQVDAYRQAVIDDHDTLLNSI